MGWADRAKRITRKVGPIRHAPWSRWFKTFYCHGSVAREFQFGPLVFYWYYAPYQGRRVKVTKDQYWRRVKRRAVFNQ